jgi:LysM repeat protein
MRAIAASLASAACMALAGCQTVDGGGYGTTAFGGGGQPPTYGQRQPRLPEGANDAVRMAVRLGELEGMVQRLQAQVDGISEASPQVPDHVLKQLDQARRDATAARSENDALKRELAALKAEQQQFRKSMDELPGRISKAVAANAPAQTAATTTRTTQQSATVGYEHIVEAGQTLSDIALAYKVKPDAIARENKLKNPNAIFVGQKLFIPRQ